MRIILIFVCSLGPWQFCHGLQPNYTYADSIAKIYHGYPLTNLKSLSDSLTQHLNSEELKFRAIFTWVCTNIESDYALLQEQKRNQKRLSADSVAWKEWQKRFSQRLFRKLVRERKTICSGYAYLIQRLSYHAGLTCSIINGYGRTSKSNVGDKPTLNHAWNAVKLDDAWFLSDATWASGQISSTDLDFKPNYDDAYFLVSPEIFIQDHFPSDLKRSYMSRPPTLEYFLKAPLVYKGAYRYRMKILDYSTGSDQVDSNVIFEFESELPALDNLHVRTNKQQVKNTHIHKDEMTYTLYFSADARRIMHIFYGSEPLFTIIPNVNESD